MKFFEVHTKMKDGKWREHKSAGRRRFTYKKARSIADKLEANGVTVRVRMSRDPRNRRVLVEKISRSKKRSGWRETSWRGRKLFTLGEAELIKEKWEKRGRRAKIREVLDQRRLNNQIIEEWLSGDLDFDRRLMVALAKVAKARRVKLHVNYGKRSYAEQAALYAKYGPGRAARPGTSRHETGKAADVVQKKFRWLNLGSILGIRKHMKKHGVGLPVPREPWHAEMTKVFNA